MLAALYCAAATAENSYVLGPVEHISKDGSSLTVLGQTYAAHLEKFGVGDLQLGEYVLLVGERSSSGDHTAVTLDRAPQPYVPGATEVFLSGSVSKSNHLTGYLTIGEVSVYIAESDLVASASIEIGDTLEIVGSQALPLGPVWASEVRVVKGMVVAQGIQGTGSLGIQGTGALGIQGTGALGIQGTGALGIQGTGTQGIQGTGKRGIQGTGKQGIQGTGTQGIQGTGSLGSQGTGTFGIQGTGAAL